MIGPADQYPPEFWNALGALDFDRAAGLIDDLEALHREVGRLLGGRRPLGLLEANLVPPGAGDGVREAWSAYRERWVKLRDALSELLSRIVLPRHDSLRRDAQGEKVYRGGGHGARRRDVRPLVRLAVRERAEGRCELCGRDEVDTRRLVLDHLWPVFHGGPRACWNLALLCDACNERKSLYLEPSALRLALRRLRWMHHTFYRPAANNPDPGRSARLHAEIWLAIETLDRNLSAT